jgi:hypothetical protein
MTIRSVLYICGIAVLLALLNPVALGQVSNGSKSAPSIDHTFHIIATQKGIFIWNSQGIWFRDNASQMWSEVNFSYGSAEGITSIQVNETGKLFVLTSRTLYKSEMPDSTKVAAELPSGSDPADMSIGKNIWVCGGTIDGAVRGQEVPNSALDASKTKIITAALWRLDEGSKRFDPVPFPSSLGRIVEMHTGSAAVIARTEFGVYTSNNDGSSWVPVHASTGKRSNHTPTALFLLGDENMWIGWSDGMLMRYGSNADRWEVVSSAQGTARKVFVKLAFESTGKGIGQSGERLFETTDGGRNWARLLVESVVDFDVTRDGHLWALTLDGVIEVAAR